MSQRFQPTPKEASGGGAFVDFGAGLSDGACDSYEDASERGTQQLAADSSTMTTMSRLTTVMHEADGSKLQVRQNIAPKAQ